MLYPTYIQPISENDQIHLYQLILLVQISIIWELLFFMKIEATLPKFISKSFEVIFYRYNPL